MLKPSEIQLIMFFLVIIIMVIDIIFNKPRHSLYGEHDLPWLKHVYAYKQYTILYNRALISPFLKEVQKCTYMPLQC